MRCAPTPRVGSASHPFAMSASICIPMYNYASACPACGYADEVLRLWGSAPPLRTSRKTDYQRIRTHSRGRTRPPSHHRNHRREKSSPKYLCEIPASMPSFCSAATASSTAFAMIAPPPHANASCFFMRTLIAHSRGTERRYACASAHPTRSSYQLIMSGYGEPMGRQNPKGAGMKTGTAMAGGMGDEAEDVKGWRRPKSYFRPINATCATNPPPKTQETAQSAQLGFHRTAATCLTVTRKRFHRPKRSPKMGMGGYILPFWERPSTPKMP